MTQNESKQQNQCHRTKGVGLFIKSKIKIKTIKKKKEQDITKTIKQFEKKCIKL